MRLWLSHVVFGWTPEPGAIVLLDDPNRVRRPHAILAHAEDLLSTNESELSIADSINNLKRAINIRLRHLEEIYKFGEMFPKEFGSLERLAYVGLARPFLVKQLFELRNNIEHRDAPPPNAERAWELVDAAWYFLRTTDSACKFVPHSVMLQSIGTGTRADPELWLEFKGQPSKDECFDINGWLPLGLVSESEQPKFLLVELACSSLEDAKGKLWIQAQANIPQDIRMQIWRLAFETL